MLCDVLEEQSNPGRDEELWMSVPGVLTGKSVRLLSHQEVPVIAPDPRGTFAWRLEDQVDRYLDRPKVDGDSKKKKKGGDGKERDEVKRKLKGLSRVVLEKTRNYGLTQQERAMNHAVTSAFEFLDIFYKRHQSVLYLDEIEVTKSAFCRPGSDCWDVSLTFFSSDDKLRYPRRVSRFTVDVSDVVPVTVSKVRTWASIN